MLVFIDLKDLLSQKNQRLEPEHHPFEKGKSSEPKPSFLGFKMLVFGGVSWLADYRKKPSS